MNKMVKVVGDGVNQVFRLSHNFGTPDVVVAIRENKLPGELVSADVTILSKNEVEISFGMIPGNNEFAITVIG